MANKYIQIHTITGYSTVLLNRDDSGMAKRMVYGGGTRTRASSQFVKRKLRVAEGEASLANLGGVSVRSRFTFSRAIAAPLVEEGLGEDAVVAATLGLMNAIYGKSDSKVEKEKKAAAKEAASGETPKKKTADELLKRDELIILGRNEIEYLKSLVRDFLAGSEVVADVEKAVAEFVADKGVKERLTAMKNTSLDMAAFGRMVTGDFLSSMDAAVHVAHAITIHSQHSEVDFFTAVDDLGGEQKDSVAHVGETEVNSPLLYGYYVIDWNQLVENLSGLDDAETVAKEMVARIIELASTQVVGAKKGSTAPYSTADFLMVEVGSAAPRTLAEAFRKPTAGTLEDGVKALASYVNKKDELYGNTAKRSVMSMVDVEINDAITVNLAGIKSATVDAI